MVDSKPMKHIKTRTPFCLYCHLLRVNMLKKNERTLFVLGNVQYLANPKNKFPVKFIVT